MKKTVQIILIIWFIIINLYILIPSFIVLQGLNLENQSVAIPIPPSPLSLTPLNLTVSLDSQKEQVNAHTQQVNAYTQEVNAFIQQVNAYKAYLESSNKFNQHTKYGLVVKDTLVALLTSLLTALVSYVFINASAGLANNYILAKNNKDVQPIQFW
jgi:hypothetical protein